MRATLIIAPIILLIFGGSFLAKTMLGPPPTAAAPGPGQYERIVSMAPSVTETLFALGLGERVVGVTRFCRYPAEAREKAPIGGYLNPNFEAIVALRPDLVVMLEDNGNTRPAFAKLGLPTLVVCHKSVDGILESIAAIGRTCKAERKAGEILGDVRSRMDRIRRKTQRLPPRRVLIAVDRTFTAGRLEDIFIVGNDGHLDRIMHLAGGQNACRQTAARFPVVSSEGILRIDPEVIIDIVPESTAASLGNEAILADWQQVAGVEAVRNARVYVVADDRASIPGPGFIRTIECFARLIHPEADWR